MTDKEIKIGKHTIGNGYPPFIIAEMACAHDGDFEKAKKLIDAAVEAGAQAVQLQFFVAEETVTPHHPVSELLKKIEFSPAQWTDLFAYAKKQGILVFVCTYDVSSVSLAVKLKADGIKLNSADLSNPEVVIAVAKSGIPFTLGTGASLPTEIEAGIKLAASHGAKNIILMHGVQNFPTKTEDLNISRVLFLKETFGLPTGYHDHTEGDDVFANVVDLIAVGMGAHVLEKHITLNRAEKGIDYQAALEPHEFKTYVERMKRAWIAYGKYTPGEFTESDLKYRKFQKKSIVAASDIKAGEVFDRGKVLYIRNAEPGMPPSMFERINGKKAARNINKFENILEQDVTV
ncbi:MAG: N-acetylneuraminate synthase family protein [Flavobacteriales bacterium]